jgi:hypothetical protein
MFLHTAARSFSVHDLNFFHLVVEVSSCQMSCARHVGSFHSDVTRQWSEPRVIDGKVLIFPSSTGLIIFGVSVRM